MSASFNNEINDIHDNISISNTMPGNTSNINISNINGAITSGRDGGVNVLHKEFEVFNFDNEFNGIGQNYNSTLESFSK